MKVANSEKVPAQPVEEGAQGTTIRWLISKESGAPNFAMRLFEVAPGGYTPNHHHAWEHEVFILSGRGAVYTSKEATAISVQPLVPGTAVLVEPQEEHQFRNTGDEPLRMLCLIPHTS